MRTKRLSRCGLDILSAQRFAPLRGARVAVLAHAASVDSSLRHIVDLLAAESTVDFLRIFSPEHGLRGAAQDMVAVSSHCDSRTGRPVISLYGGSVESLALREEDLQEIDLLLVDLCDVGSRYYTYAQTMALAMQTAVKSKVKVVVLDRPNPINGATIEGGPLAKGCQSFCGFAPLANRHGLTIGELARLYQQGFGEGEEAYPPIACELEIVQLEGWRRKQYFDETGLPWVPPSPNMPALNTALVYPGTCLFEATNISEGRGTTRPFELLGAPFIDGLAWAAAAAREIDGLSGAVLRPISFLPQFHKWKGESCGGVQIHIVDRSSFQPLRWALALISAAKKLYPREFRWRGETYEFVENVPAIDLLFGNSSFREAVDDCRDIRSVVVDLAVFERSSARRRKALLMY